jgi:serine/threonine protein kinase
MDSFGPFQIVGELGRGAMAVVWQAYDPSLERYVAIKEPQFGHAGNSDYVAETRERFVRESRAAAGLNHPGIVTIYGVAEYDGRAGIIMELIDGATLGSLERAGRVSVRTSLSVVDQLLGTIGYAHAQGVVHRDLKPDNLFLLADGRVKIADFGLAQTGWSSQLTIAGTVLGTPGYMSPEQVESAPIDARSDLFSIGVMAYELLSGHNPFGSAPPDSATTVMYRIVHDEPRDLGQICPELPDGVARTVELLLSKDPADRPESAELALSYWRGEVRPPARPFFGFLRRRNTPVSANASLAAASAARGLEAAPAPAAVTFSETIIDRPVPALELESEPVRSIRPSSADAPADDLLEFGKDKTSSGVPEDLAEGAPKPASETPRGRGLLVAAAAVAIMAILAVAMWPRTGTTGSDTTVTKTTEASGTVAPKELGGSTAQSATTVEQTPTPVAPQVKLAAGTRKLTRGKATSIKVKMSDATGAPLSGTAILEQKTSGTWKTVATLAIEGGSGSVRVSPKSTVNYRVRGTSSLGGPQTTSAAVRIAVASPPSAPRQKVQAAISKPKSSPKPKPKPKPEPVPATDF